MRSLSIRTHVMILVMMVSVPLVLIFAYALYSDMQQSIAHTKSSLRIVGSTMVRNTGNKIANARNVLEKLSTRPLVRKRDPANCDPVLQNLKEISREYANIGYSNINGQVACSAVPSPTGKPINLFRAPWYQQVLRKKDFSISKPFLGPFTGKWVTVLSAPIWNEAHDMVGVISLPLDNNSFDPNIPEFLLPENSRFGFFSNDGTLVWRNVDPDNLIGKRPDSEAARKIVSMQHGEFESVAFDGTPRYISAMPLPEADMVAFVAVPSASLYAEAKRRAVTSALYGMVIISLLYLMALFISRRITQPVIALEHFVRKVREGVLNVAVEERGPSEIADVAREFNRMVATQQNNLQELRIAAIAFESHESMMITDSKSIILKVNHGFEHTTGYRQEEIVGKTPRILKSGRHDEAFYQEMWRSLRETGRWSGEIWDRKKSGEVYPKWLSISAVKDADGKVTNYVCSQMDLTEMKQAEEKINHLAYFDSLTNLPNRRLLMDRLQHAVNACARGGCYGALLFLDLDNFKSLNDTQGHEVGDQLLKQVAERLVSSIRKGDTVARLGGDEFVLVLDNLGSNQNEAASKAEAVCELIMSCLSQTYILGSHEFNCTASMGVTLFSNELIQVDELMKQADISMYQAKKSGRNSVSFFDGRMQEIITRRVRLESELRKAVTHQQFAVFYQQQVNEEGKIFGAEALLRWHHPEQGIMLPSDFIPLAEDSGMILPVGHWVMSEVCKFLASLPQHGGAPDLVIAVNISAKQFHLPTFVEEVLGLTRFFGVAPSRLKLEITESMLLDRKDEIVRKMNVLKSHGFSFSLDDFGTGYSSLQYLKELPIDQLKIDQSFVSDLQQNESDRAIVRTIIAMAQSLNVDVISEGVETEAQFNMLLDMGCRRFQGYLFGKPSATAEFVKILHM